MAMFACERARDTKELMVFVAGPASGGYQVAVITKDLMMHHLGTQVYIYMNIYVYSCAF